MTRNIISTFCEECGKPATGNPTDLRLEGWIIDLDHDDDRCPQCRNSPKETLPTTDF